MLFSSGIMTYYAHTIDVDECATPGRCQHICNNRVGRFFCTCYEGYQLVEGINCTGKISVFGDIIHDP